MNMLTRQMDRQKEKNFYDLLLGEETGRYVYRMLALKQIMAFNEVCRNQGLKRFNVL